MTKINLDWLHRLPKAFARLSDFDHAQREPLPYRDWQFLLVAFFFLLIASAAIHFLIFIFLNTQDLLVQEGSERTIQEKDLEEALKRYGAKEDRFNDSIKNLPKISDPAR